MKQFDRHDLLLKLLDEYPVLSVAKAMQLTSASRATIRRDLDELAQLGLVERFHGGIRRREGRMTPYASREAEQTPEKQLIARKAVELLQPGQVIMIDGGTTTFQMSACLPSIPLRVITNSMRLAAELDQRRPQHPGLEIFLTGGLLYPDSGGLLVGRSAEQTLGQYFADLAFLSVSGVAAQGFFNTNEPVVEVERRMIAQSNQVVILADHTKLNRCSMCHVCTLDEADCLITDGGDEDFLRTVSNAGVRILTAN